MGKVAADSYKAAESPLKQLGRQRVLRDFKPSTSIHLGEMGRLEEIAESGEIKASSRAETGESMSLKTYARGINVSRNLLVNDDLNLLGDMTAAFGEAAAQTEADEMVKLLTSNPNLSDGTPVFDLTRGNISAVPASLSDAGAGHTALSAARKAMRGFKGTDGKTLINVVPKYLLVGPETETYAEQLLAAIYPATVDDVNVMGQKLTLLVEPRITDDSWYVFADPARVASMAYGYLASAQGVQIQRAEAWDTLGIKFRAFLDFGTGWSDWRGAYQNPGNN
jgi:phage major head subunit gpT-like protein